jgi:hypothetical protein
MLLSECVLLLIESLFVEFTSGTDRVMVRIKRLNDIMLSWMFEKGFIEKEKIIFVGVVIGDIESNVCVEHDDDIKRVGGNRLGK